MTSLLKMQRRMPRITYSSGAQSSGRRVVERVREACGNSPRNRARRNDSKLSRCARSMSLQCIFGEGVELAGGDIRFQLTIPGFGVKSHEPLAKRRKLVRGECLNLV